MTARRYSLLGWLVWKLGGLFLRRKLRQERGRLIALAVIAAVILAGLGIARAEAERDD